MRIFLNVIILTFLICSLPVFAQESALSFDVESIVAILQGLSAKYKVVFYTLSGLGSLVILGISYVAITPTKDDDAKLQKLEQKPILGLLLRILKRFSFIERKEKK